MKQLNLNKQELNKLLKVVKEQSIFPNSIFRSDNMLNFIDKLELQIKNKTL